MSVVQQSKFSVLHIRKDVLKRAKAAALYSDMTVQEWASDVIEDILDTQESLYKWFPKYDAPDRK